MAVASKKPGKVRITGGEYRGKWIKTPGGKVHPMGERERIALFNMISDRIPGNYVMDLYCGGGTLGIEALSRGANFVMFIDNNWEALEVAHDNLKKLGLWGYGGLTGDPSDIGTGRTLQADIPLVMRTATDRYGVVIADPPYDDYNEKMVKYLPRVVLDGGILVLSHPGEPPELTGVRLVKTRQYARAHISIYVKD